jgi:hypothetical protein
VPEILVELRALEVPVVDRAVCERLEALRRLQAGARVAIAGDCE